MKNLQYSLIALFFILVSCKQEEVEWFDLNIEYPGQVEAFNEGKMPYFLVPFVNYQNYNSCKTTLYIPHITVKRMDVGVSKKLDVPFTTQAKMQKKLNMLSAQNVRDGYKVEDLKLPDFLNKSKSDFEKSEIKSLKAAKKNIIEISADANKEQLEKVQKQMEKLLCKNKIRTITIRITQQETTNDENENEAVTENEEENQNTPNNEQVTTTNEKNTDTGLTKNEEKTVSSISHTKTKIVAVNTINYTKKNGIYHSSFAKYEGGMIDGKAQGQGTMVFTRNNLIPVPPYSSKKITAKKGYKLAGRFNKGYIVSGTLYDTNGKKIKAIYIGR